MVRNHGLHDVRLPTTQCCTKHGLRAETNYCAASPFLDGSQVCGDCLNFQGIACPAESSFCCDGRGPNAGTCVPDVSQCLCTSTPDCPTRYCCDGAPATMQTQLQMDRKAKLLLWLPLLCVHAESSGTCSHSVFINGTQVCTGV